MTVFTDNSLIRPCRPRTVALMAHGLAKVFPPRMTAESDAHVPAKRPCVFGKQPTICQEVGAESPASEYSSTHSSASGLPGLTTTCVRPSSDCPDRGYSMVSRDTGSAVSGLYTKAPAFIIGPLVPTDTLPVSQASTRQA
jgi:hypothetical protein